jgi:hypothetical protein
MAKYSLWTDEYWLLLIQVYLKKPVGVKPLYSRALVDLSMELHIRPQYLYEQMFRLRQLDTPHMEQLWAKYGKNPKKLSREVNLFRQMKGFGQADEFYSGVDVNESFERNFKPLDEDARLCPIHLILILDLFFQLTPITMVVETPEIIDLAKLLKVPASLIVEVMNVFQFCDPYLNRDDMMIDPLLVPCQAVWQRYGSENPEKLSALASQLKDYFK